MTLNGVMAVILRYFTELGSSQCAMRKTGWRRRHDKTVLSGWSRSSEMHVETSTHRLRHQLTGIDIISVTGKDINSQIKTSTHRLSHQLTDQDINSQVKTSTHRLRHQVTE